MVLTNTQQNTFKKQICLSQKTVTYSHVINTLNNKIQEHVMIDCMCYFDWATGCPVMWLNMILEVTVRAVLNAVSI